MNHDASTPRLGKRKAALGAPAGTLFALPPRSPCEPVLKTLTFPVWTENKAKFISRYLYYFVLVTKHGTYIDGFAGPQARSKPETWAAKLVLESEPKWIRNVFLFEKGRRQLSALEGLCSQHDASEQEGAATRRVVIRPGDVNRELIKAMKSGDIPQKDATFALLDQRTFECHWATVRALARYHTGKYKIEIFYFFPIAWLDRAISGVKDSALLRNWWGGEGWVDLKGLCATDRAARVAERFRKELGYASAKPWPIYESKAGPRIMYYMIHATDHPDAPSLMQRAYATAIRRVEPLEQLWLEFGKELPDGCAR